MNTAATATATASQPNAATSYANALFDSIRSLFVRSATNSPQQQKRGKKRHRDHDKTAASASTSVVHDSRKRRRNYHEISGWVETSTISAPAPSSTNGTVQYNSITGYLRSIPSVVERVEQLHTKKPILLSNETNARIINVLQGEMAHATSSQADILVSDHATTCHILAARSSMSSSTDEDAGVGTDTNILTSLCHIDQPGYERCIRDMIELHKHHHKQYDCTSTEEKKEGGGLTSERITMELHIVGGFSDRKRSSLSITEYLVELLGRLAKEEEESISFVIKTCAVSCLNDDGSGSPVGRGLAIDIKSGEAYLAKVDAASVAGPAVALRNCHLWAGASTNRLSVIHTPSSDRIIVEPFDFVWDEDCEYLYSLSDKRMLRETSTSPNVEEDDYCDHIRSTLKYLLENNAEDVFGPCCLTPVQYERSKPDADHSNKWIIVEESK